MKTQSGLGLGRGFAPPVSTGAVCDPFDLVPLASEVEREKLAVFGACVPGKSARIVWPKVQALFVGLAPGRRPFEQLADWVAADALAGELARVKMGQYARIGNALADLSRVPAGWEWDRLLWCRGVNYKTAKLSQLYTWPGGNCACVDRHVLKWLNACSWIRRHKTLATTSSPQDPVTYRVLEAVVLARAEELSLAPWYLDKVLWRAGEAGADPQAAICEARSEVLFKTGLGAGTHDAVSDRRVHPAVGAAVEVEDRV